MATLLLRGAHVLDLHVPFEPADVYIRDGVIVATGRGLQAAADETIDAAGMILMPGFVSAHTHAVTTFDRGLAENLPLDPWMCYVVAGGPELSPRGAYLAAALGAIELLRSGTTTLLDHVRVNPTDIAGSIAPVIQAFVDVGIRAGAAPSYSDLPFSQTLPLYLLDGEIDTAAVDLLPVAPASTIVAGCRAFLEAWTERHPRITPLLGPSGPQRCSEALLMATVDLAREFGCRLHTHLLEAKSQALVAQHRFGCTTAEYLSRIGFLGPSTSLAHGVWLTTEEMAILADAGAAVVHNPVSNLRLGSGIAHLQELRGREVRVALGVDGPGSGDSYSMFEVIKLAACLHRVYGEAPNWPMAEDCLKMAWEDGADLLGHRSGRIEPGYAADLVLLDTRRLFLLPKPQMLRQLVYTENGAAVHSVIVDGRVVLKGGTSVHVDEARLRAEAQDLLTEHYSHLARREQSLSRALPVLNPLAAAVTSARYPAQRLARLE